VLVPNAAQLGIDLTMRNFLLICAALLVFTSCERSERRDAIDIRQVEAMVCRGAAPVEYEKWPQKTRTLFFGLCGKHNDAVESFMTDYAGGESMRTLMPRYFKLRKRHAVFREGFPLYGSAEQVQETLEQMKAELF
jgi:hypothetical protein